MTEHSYWVAGWNQPGYLPVMEPAAFADYDDALEFIREEIACQVEQVYCGMENPNHPNEREKALLRDYDHATCFFMGTLADVAKRDFGGSCFESADGYAYWIDSDSAPDAETRDAILNSEY